MLSEAEALDLTVTLSSADGKLAGLIGVYTTVIGEPNAELEELRERVQTGLLMLTQKLGGAPIEQGEPT